MVQALRDIQISAGAEVATTAVLEPVMDYGGNGAIALEAARTGVALYDATHWGRIQVTGGDRLQFLHNQSTNRIQPLQPGEGCETVFVTSTARTLDLVQVYVQQEDVILLTSPATRDSLITWMDRFIFPFDKVTLKNITTQTATFQCIGPQSHALLSQLGLELDPQLPLHTHRPAQIQEIPVTVAVGTGLALPGYTLRCEIEQAAALWEPLSRAAETVPLGERAWERLRIEQGRPAVGRELTEDFNPLEAGLWHRVSFEKGCYIGQETIARLDTYKGVKQKLWGIHLPAMVPVGAKVLLAGEPVGQLTSIVETESGAVGLAYIRTKAGGAGLSVTLEGIVGEVVAVPYLVHERQDRAASTAP
jgi:folate-binding protein YgfZ